jgi:single stranded DNA-binding protein
MASLDKVQLIGHLGRDPECAPHASGTAIATLSIATSERRKDKDTGEPKRPPSGTAVSHGRNAELAAEHLATGSQVYVEGALCTRKWTDAQNVDATPPSARLRHQVPRRQAQRQRRWHRGSCRFAASKPATKRVPPRPRRARQLRRGGPGTDWDDIPP